MKYISKGAVLRPCTEEILYVSRCGREYALTKPMSTLWLEGRFRVSHTISEFEEAKLAHLQNIGLVEVAGDGEATEIYRMISRCIILPAKPKLNRRCFLKQSERYLWTWISLSGMHLTMAELIFLASNGVRPDAALLGPGNLQSLTERIYSAEASPERLLDTEMEKAADRDAVVNALLGLLRKKHLVLV